MCRRVVLRTVFGLNGTPHFVSLAHNRRPFRHRTASKIDVGGDNIMQKPRGRATFTLLCYYLGAATTTRTLPTAVSGFHHPCATGRVRRRSAGQALSPPPRQQLSNQRRSRTPVEAAQQQPRGWGSSLMAGGGSVGGSGSSRSDASPRGGGSRQRSPGRATAPSSSVLQCAAGDDEDNNYVSFAAA